jgi:hypothetical protein
MRNLEDLQSQLQNTYLFMLTFFVMIIMFGWFLYRSLQSAWTAYSNYDRLLTAAQPKDTMRALNADNYPPPSSDEFYLNTDYNEEIIRNLESRGASDTLALQPQLDMRKKADASYEQQSRVDVSTLSKDYDDYQRPKKAPSTKSFWYYLVNPA